MMRGWFAWISERWQRSAPRAARSPLQEEVEIDWHDAFRPLSQLLTVVITTSPISTHPSTAMLEEVVGSFALVPGLRSCPTVVVFDGYKVKDQPRYRSGAAAAPHLSPELGAPLTDASVRRPGDHRRGRAIPRVRASRAQARHRQAVGAPGAHGLWVRSSYGLA